MATERMSIKLPAGFDPNRHLVALTKKIEEKHGEGWEITHIDSSANAAVAIRQQAITEVAETQSKPDSFEVKLAKGTKPSDAERMVTRLEDQYVGYSVTRFEPFLGIAEMTKLDRATVRARGASANALGVKPWDVQIGRRKSDKGWDIALPDTYVPSKHYDKLVEVAEEIIGTLGWTVEADADKLTASFVPGDPPIFPPAIPYPLDEPVTEWKPGGGSEWAKIPLGWKLGRRADDPVNPLFLDVEASPHAQISGISGAGKSATLNAFIAGVLARRASLVIVDLPAKAVDFMWCQRFLRPDGGWGCENLDEAVTALALVYEEGQRRGKVLAAEGVTKWTDLPKHKMFEPIVVIVDEVTGLFIQEKVPKGLDADHPLVVEAKEVNTKKAMLEAYIAKTAAELRFVGVKLVLSSQVSSTTTGVSTAIRMNLGNKILLGRKPTKNNRNLSLSDAGSVPLVPSHVAEDDKAGRGAGVFEFEGQAPGVFKSFWATTDEYAAWLSRLGVATTDHPRPRATEVAKRTSLLVDERSAEKKKPVETDPGDGVWASAGAGPVGPVCETCDGRINPQTSECHCSF